MILHKLPVENLDNEGGFKELVKLLNWALPQQADRKKTGAHIVEIYREFENIKQSKKTQDVILREYPDALLWMGYFDLIEDQNIQSIIKAALGITADPDEAINQYTPAQKNFYLMDSSYAKLRSSFFGVILEQKTRTYTFQAKQHRN